MNYKWQSDYRLLAGNVVLPLYRGVRILHMPVVFGDAASLPNDLLYWRPLLALAAKKMPEHAGKVVYLTIDEKEVKSGQTQRRPGLHVDGYWQTEDSANGGGTWGGGGSWGGSSGSRTEGTGLLTISRPGGCMAWR